VSGLPSACFRWAWVREILGAGTLFGVALFGAGFQPWVIMVLPPGGFFVLGSWLLFFAWLERRKLRRQSSATEVTQHV
jgi:electron transport complex protein RnfE